jgi:Transglycosylase SLT domain
MALGFASILLGAIVTIAGVTGSSIASVVQGKPDKSKATTPSGGASSTAGGSTAGGTPGSGGDAPSPTVAGKAGVAAAKGGASTAEMKELVQRISKEKGWNAADWEAVIEKESGWDPTATNPSSGAFGIGQFLGATKAEYRKYGSESTNPLEQIIAMSVYIQTRYGNPTAALAHENSNHWY